MKRIWILFLFVFVFWTATVLAQEVMGPHYFGVERGIVEYDLKGAVKGQETLYFDNWGMRQARFTKSETQNWGTINTITLNLNNEIIFIDPGKKIGQKKEDLNLKETLKDYKPEDMTLLSSKSLMIMGGEKLKDENFLEHLCEVWETKTPKMKLWVFQGIILKAEIETEAGGVYYSATRFDVTTPVDEKFFSVPEDIKFINEDINQILISRN